MRKGVSILLFLLAFTFSAKFYSQTPIESDSKIPLNYSLFYSSEDVYLAFNELLKPSVLTKRQLSDLLTIVKRVSDSLSLRVTLTNTKTEKTDILQHNFQIVSAIDKKGQIIVWVNAVCDPKREWKKQLVFIDDGGSCYYNFQVNLSQKRYYNISINGSG